MRLRCRSGKLGSQSQLEFEILEDNELKLLANCGSLAELEISSRDAVQPIVQGELKEQTIV